MPSESTSGVPYRNVLTTSFGATAATPARLSPRIMLRAGSLVRLVLFGVLTVLAGNLLPLPTALGAGSVLFLLVTYRQYRVQRGRFEGLVQKLASLKGGVPPVMRVTDREDLESLFYRTSIDLASALEKTSFKLVEKNIQLLSLKEIGRSIVSTLEESALQDTVLEYLHKGLGFKEIVLVIFNPVENVFGARIFTDYNGRIEQQRLRATREDLGPTLRRVMSSGTSHFIRDARMHPLEIFEEPDVTASSTMSSYAVVPLFEGSSLTSGTRVDSAGGGGSGGRVGRRAEDPRGPKEVQRDERFRGALVVTDGYRALPLSRLDLVTLETLAAHVATALENWSLYTTLKRSERFRVNIIESIFNGLIAVDRGGRITLVNASALKLLDAEQHEVLGKDVDELITGRERGGEGDSPVRLILQGKTEPFLTEAYLRREDGRKIPIKLNCSLLQNESREVDGAVGVFTDMTTIIKMEAEIRNLDKLAALGRLTSSIAHEIRNPLSGIAAGIQYMERHNQGKPLPRENARFILSEVERLDRIIDSLFQVARPRELMTREIAVDEVVERGLNSVRDLSREAGVRLESRIDGDLPWAPIDPEQIHQVLLNLLKNAVEATEEGGVISVTADMIRPGGEDHPLPAAGSEDFLRIRVTDSGPGMSDDEANRIFEPFYTTKSQGTGLGLYVSHSIVERHGGHLRVESRPGKGTSFLLYLPIEGARVARA
jgi:PAS domain S-box-containing protein